MRSFGMTKVVTSKESIRMLGLVFVVLILCSTYIVTKEDQTIPPPLKLQDYLLPSKRPVDLSQNCNSTIVTAYYKVNSKHPHEEYLNWMINFLSLKDCVVVFAQPDLVETIQALRPPSYPTLVIPRPLSSFLVNSLLSPENWKHQEDLDPEKNVGHSAQLYQIWNEKSNMLKIVVDINPFSSDFFVWLDIGAIRHTQYNHQLMVQQIPNDKGVLLLNVDNFTKEERALKGSETVADFTHVNRIGGGTIGCGRESCYLWHQAYYNVMKRFLVNDKFIGKDQSLMATVCVETGMCLLVQSNIQDWFKLQQWFRKDIQDSYHRLDKLS